MNRNVEVNKQQLLLNILKTGTEIMLLKAKRNALVIYKQMINKNLKTARKISTSFSFN